MWSMTTFGAGGCRRGFDGRWCAPMWASGGPYLISMRWTGAARAVPAAAGSMSFVRMESVCSAQFPARSHSVVAWSCLGGPQWTVGSGRRCTHEQGSMSCAWCVRRQWCLR
eukprot:4654548-Alexandrium_andersonii.AAC.1